jgi:predicted DCC family thiol-disulfide oxidoreductase YuxK
MTLAASERDIVFYDGDCGLCHGLVRFAVLRDEDGALAFAPLGGSTFAACVPEARRTAIPDSFVVLTCDGELLLRSAGVVRVLKRLPEPWSFAGSLLRLLPRPLRDAGYRGVARARNALFARPSGACPVVPVALRERFLP